MQQIKVAIVGYGNIGKYLLEALQHSPDFELTGIVRRNPQEDQPIELQAYRVVSSLQELSQTQVAILAVPSRSVQAHIVETLSMGINTVDSFDIHGDIWQLKQQIDQIAKVHQRVSIISAGWDPGSDSIVRALMQAAAPNGLTYTNFGPGMSMGHTVAVKAISGVKDGLAMTIPLGSGVHRRMVYIELEKGYDFDRVASEIKADAYFVKDETNVTLVEDVNALRDMGHGAHIIRKGAAGKTQNQLFEFNMRVNNPALTAQMLVAAARASTKQAPGCYTMIELPLIDLLPGSQEELIRRLV